MKLTNIAWFHISSLVGASQRALVVSEDVMLVAVAISQAITDVTSISLSTLSPVVVQSNNLSQEPVIAGSVGSQFLTGLKIPLKKGREVWINSSSTDCWVGLFCE